MGSLSLLHLQLLKNPKKGESLLRERIRHIENHGRLHSHAPPFRADDDGKREGTSRQRAGCIYVEVPARDEAPARTRSRGSLQLPKTGPRSGEQLSEKVKVPVFEH